MCNLLCRVGLVGKDLEWSACRARFPRCKDPDARLNLSDDSLCSLTAMQYGENMPRTGSLGGRPWHTTLIFIFTPIIVTFLLAPILSGYFVIPSLENKLLCAKELSQISYHPWQQSRTRQIPSIKSKKQKSLSISCLLFLPKREDLCRVVRSDNHA